MSDAETCRSDTRVYFIYLKGAFVGVMNRLSLQILIDK
jgi:hypothetical protein